MKLIFTLHCDRDKIFESHKLKQSEIEIVKIDEKYLAKYSFIVKAINRDNYEEVFLATKDISFQRFQRFFRLYLMISKAKKGGIIDEYGNKSEYSFLGVFFKDLPMLALEAVVSSVIVVFYYIKLPWLKWRLKKY